jgi:hypothetical protein
MTGKKEFRKNLFRNLLSEVRWYKRTKRDNGNADFGYGRLVAKEAMADAEERLESALANYIWALLDNWSVEMDVGD